MGSSIDDTHTVRVVKIPDNDLSLRGCRFREGVWWGWAINKKVFGYATIPPAIPETASTAGRCGERRRSLVACPG